MDITRDIFGDRIVQAWGSYFDTTPVKPMATGGIATAAQRYQMAGYIFGFEAEYINGHLAIENLPIDDGGGAREVAGINMRYDAPEEARLEILIKAQQYAEAKDEAINYIGEQTAGAIHWCIHPAVEFCLRDMIFNRGPTGCMKTLQKAIGAETDGVYGPLTEALEQKYEKDIQTFLQDFRSAREWYEDVIVGRRQNFEQGLINRWNNCLLLAKTFV